MMAFYIVVCFSKDVNFEELARCTDDFNGAQCKAVCVEAVRLLFAIFPVCSSVDVASFRV